MTDILWSFKTGDIEIIEGRKTFGVPTELSKLNSLTIPTSSSKYPSVEWNQGFENICEIFDTQFINENIS